MKLEDIYNKIYDLSEFTAVDQFKSYEQLKARLDTVLSRKAVVTPTRQDEDLDDLSEGRGNTVEEELSNLRASATPASADVDTEEEDDALSYFQKLAEE